MQSLLDDKKYEINCLTKFDSRESTMKEMQSSFVGMKQMMDDHQRFRKGQLHLLNEYTNMIDIGIQKKPRKDQCPQTYLSLRMENIASDASIIENAAQPVSLCALGAQNESINLTKYAEYQTLYQYTQEIIQKNAKVNFQQTILSGFMNEQGTDLEIPKLQAQCHDLV